MTRCPICGERTRSMLSTIAGHGLGSYQHRCLPETLAAIDEMHTACADELDDAATEPSFSARLRDGFLILNGAT